ncbi:RxLR effector protein [Phytophthora megakarya]|uniref:RxLR effector protein n=1 Tax=Phytophthora megakarya TaxID=4795 RepID=A0A225WEL4_9STRA|nr:RxLR effector protein [Phytophthora megakarya]
MRFTYAILLAAVTTFLTTSSAATHSNNSRDLSTVSSDTTDIQALSGEKRLLRYVESDDLADEEKNEERAKSANLFSKEKLNLMIRAVNRANNGDEVGLASLYKRFPRWDRKGYNTYITISRIFCGTTITYDELRKKYNFWLHN